MFASLIPFFCTEQDKKGRFAMPEKTNPFAFQDGDAAIEFDPSGHRQRMKNQYLQKGLESFRDYELLEMLLFFIIPRRDTRVLSRRLLNTFGDLDSVFRASPEQLCSVAGIGEKTASFLVFFQQLAEEYLTRLSAEYTPCEKARFEKTVSPLFAQQYLAASFSDEKPPFYSILCQDNVGAILCCQKITASEPLDIREIGLLISEKAAAFVTVGHHLPCVQEELKATEIDTAEQIATIACNLKSWLQDYILFTPETLFSFRDEGYLDDFYFE